MWKQVSFLAGVFLVGVLLGFVLSSRGPDLSSELADAERRYQEAVRTLERAEDGIQRIGETLGAAVSGLDDLDESIGRAAAAAEGAIRRAGEAESRAGDLQGRVGELEATVALGASVGAGASARHREIEDLIGRILSGGTQGATAGGQGGGEPP